MLTLSHPGRTRLAKGISFGFWGLVFTIQFVIMASLYDLDEPGFWIVAGIYGWLMVLLWRHVAGLASRVDWDGENTLRVRKGRREYTLSLTDVSDIRTVLMGVKPGIPVLQLTLKSDHPLGRRVRFCPREHFDIRAYWRRAEDTAAARLAAKDPP